MLQHTQLAHNFRTTLLPRGKALEKKAYEIFLIFGFLFYFVNKVYVIFFSALPLGYYDVVLMFWRRNDVYTTSF